MIINYKTFSDNKSFVQWQKENDIESIINVSPFVNDIKTNLNAKEEELTDGNETEIDGSMTANISIFVTYIEDD